MNTMFALRGVRTTEVKKNASRIAFIEENTGRYRLETINHTGCSMEGNFFISDGKQENVLKVYAKKRIGSFSFTEAMQTTLVSHFNNIVGKKIGVYSNQ